MSLALTGFAAADFSAWRPAEAMWSDPPFHVDRLHGDIADRLVAEFFARTRGAETPAIGQTLLGAAGSGKTHLLSTLRRRIWEGGGWVIRIDAIGVEDFWGAAALSFVESISRRMANGAAQASTALLAVLKRVSDSPAARAVAASRAREPLNKAGAVDLLLAMLGAVAPNEAARHGDVIRAVALLESRDPAASAFATQWLQGAAGEESRQRSLGFHGPPPAPADIVEALAWLLSLAGPTLIVVEGIDSLAAEAGSGAPRANAVLEKFATGLAKLQGLRHRTLTLVSCLPGAWEAFAPHVPPGQFRNGRSLPPLDQAQTIERLIASRLAPAYAQAGFMPPFAAYPFSPGALEGGIGLSPREALLRCRRHQQECVAQGEISLCGSFAAPSRPLPAVWRNNDETARCDEAFARARADIRTPPTGETALASLLVAACALFPQQLDLPDSADASGGAASPTSPLNARLIFVLREGGERQERWGFLVCEEENPIAFEARIRAASLAAGLETGLAGRRLAVLRRAPVPEASAVAAQAFLDAGGLFVAPDDDDMLALAALRRLADANLTGFLAWLRRRKPLFATTLFKAAKLAPPDFLSEARAESSPIVAAALSPPLAPLKTEPERARALTLGRAAEAGTHVGPVTIETELLPRHVAVSAEAAKGTILRRLIEEAALAGVPVLAIDSSGELARIGEPWPSRPAEFSDEDARRARAYFERVEVVVWTPGLEGGQDIALDPLPDFAALGQGAEAGRVEAREQAIEMAIATLEPHLVGSGAKAIKQRGVLADSLRYFGRVGGSFDQFLGWLADLPATVSRIADASLLARDIASQLLAASATGALSSPDEVALDLAHLFESPSGKTRISIVSLAGLASDAGRAGFVNQLQIALFGWIANQPNIKTRLYVIDEARPFAPIRENPASRRSALFLAKQASRNGLGMIVGTSEPQGVDPALLRPFAAQVYGDVKFLGAEESADLSALKPGEIYLAAEGLPKRLKVRLSPNFSRRAQNAPTLEDIVALARRRL